MTFLKNAASKETIKDAISAKDSLGKVFIL